MAKKIRLNAVEREGELLHADLTRPDGLPHRQTFPVDTLEWRAAEYDIDPADTDTLLDMVLSEPFLDPDPDDPALSLFDAPDIEQARAHHLKKVAKVQVDKDPKAWEDVKGHCVMHPEALDLKREHVRRVREVSKKVKAAEKTATRDTRDTARIAQLRAALESNKPERGNADA